MESPTGENRRRLYGRYCHFDPNTIEDKATFVKPHQYPVGIPYVILNGQLAVDEEKFMNILAGKVLRKNEIQ